MTKKDIKVFYGIHGGIVSGVYGTLESCIASHGKYHEFNNFYDARFFACTGTLPDNIQAAMDNTSTPTSETDKKKVYFVTEDDGEEGIWEDTTDDKKKDDIKEELASGLRCIADSLEKEDRIDKIVAGIKALSDKLSSWKVENTSAGDKVSRLHRISAEIEDLISLMRQRLNITKK